MRNSLTRNAIANVLQMLVGALLVFVLYRYISTNLGVDKLGVWSVVLATASASRLADFGLSAGVTRFVAQAIALDQQKKAAQIVETGIVSLMVFVAVVLMGLYPFLSRLLAHLFDAIYLIHALEILPLALISLWLTIAASVAQSGLDGCQRMVSRAVLAVMGQVLMVLLAYALVPSLGLLGLAWAQIGQGVFLLAGGWLLLRHNLPRLRIVPWRWHRPVFREMLSYGANVQVANVLMLLFDPLTKLLMAKFGGPVSAGQFEIANQVALRVRSMIAAANQAIVPRIAHMAESAPLHLQAIYRENIRMLVLVALPIHALLFAWADLLSELLLADHQAQFVFFLRLSVLAWFINTFAGPAYFVNLGIGNVSLNTFSHAAMGVLNLLFGWILGEIFGASGVAWGYVLALAIGSSWLMIFFQSRHDIRWRDLMLVEHIPLIGASLFVALLGIASSDFPPRCNSNYACSIAFIFLPVLLLSITLWLHPLRLVLWRRFFANLE